VSAFSDIPNISFPLWIRTFVWYRLIKGHICLTSIAFSAVLASCTGMTDICRTD